MLDGLTTFNNRMYLLYVYVRMLCYSGLCRWWWKCFHLPIMCCFGPLQVCSH